MTRKVVILSHLILEEPRFMKFKDIYDYALYCWIEGGEIFEEKVC